MAAPTPGSTPGALEDALRALDTCAGKLDPQLDVGYARIAVRCPQLSEHLARADIEPWLPQGWRDAGNDLSAGGLRELHTLLARELAAAPAGLAPSAHALRGVLAELGAGAQQRGGVWSRVRNWLRTLAARRADPQEPGYLARLVGRIGLPQTVMRALGYAALAGVVALAAWIIAHELRVSGLSARRRARSEAPGIVPALLRGAGAGTDWGDIERASLSERLPLLLAAILERIGAAQSLGALRSLTTRELLATVRWPRPEGGARLAELAFTAERARYAGTPLAQAELVRAVEDGRELLEQLSIRVT